MTNAEISEYNDRRRKLISRMRSRRCKGKPTHKLPPALRRNKIWMAETRDGDYIGSFPEGMSQADAADLLDYAGPAGDIKWTQVFPTYGN